MSAQSSSWISVEQSWNKEREAQGTGDFQSCTAPSIQAQEFQHGNTRAEQGAGAELCSVGCFVPQALKCENKKGAN